jgi:hypothetical protein
MIFYRYNLVYHTWEGLGVSSVLVADLPVSLIAEFIQLSFEEYNYSDLALLFVHLSRPRSNRFLWIKFSL